MLEWIKRLFAKQEKAVFEVVGYMDHKYTADLGKEDKLNVMIRSVFLQTADGQRRVEWGDDAFLRMLGQNRANNYMVTTSYQQIKAWEKGGPLPDSFTPMKISTLKPNKLPPSIRHEYNQKYDR